MLNFSNFLVEDKGGKNLHLEHIEDEILNFGIDGARGSINFVRSLRDMLAGANRSSVNMTVKWDGAPAIFAGQDPSDGKFFVAKKGVFAKNPKVYKTNADIDADISSQDLATKMKLALKHLPELGITGVIQGDFLFSKGDTKDETIDGQKYTTFHPNTIIYAIPYDQAKEVRAAKIGIVWHTTYTGDSFESMRATYGVDVSKFRNSVNVWSQDAMLRDVSGATMNKTETAAVTKHLSDAGKLFNQISGTTLRELESKQHIAQLIEQYNNTFVRDQKVIPNSKLHVNRLIQWINTKFKKEMDKRKSEKGKLTQAQKLNDILKFFSASNKRSLVNMFELQKNIVLAKLKLINKLNSISSFDTFVQTKTGYKVKTGAEGFVAIDKLGGDAVKLVDRLEFSYNNFSPDILKGWEKP